ncbi:hypothetical protein N657DRAFT_646921 [Parathielavia appendiculata]|uniref:Uncharacterized protein n=1 Tax=Parathielavia appendiculata TaxID=2587402 RepID=A0AAN6TX22_9PEZI|nr:hypothetical protein N657DRAFT_646921 [Parathielavia appendiculata]
MRPSAVLALRTAATSCAITRVLPPLEITPDTYSQPKTNTTEPPNHRSDFKEEDIIKTYCDAHRDNCINGTTQTDPLQALYICLPPNASPVETWLDSSYQANKQMIAHGGTSSPDDDLEKTKPYTKPTKLLSPRARPTPHPEHKEQHLKRTHHMANLYTKTYHHHHNLLNHNGELAKQSSSEATHQPTTSSTTSAAAPFLTPLVPVSLSAAGTGTGIGTRTDTTSASSTVPRPSTPSSNSCSSSATVPNNKIELLCSCGRQCLNPMGDHIGRCDVPCSS